MAVKAQLFELRATDPASENLTDAERAARAALSRADAARSEPERAEAAVQEALTLAPADFEVRLGAYRFYFYAGRLTEALPHALHLIEHAARRLNIAGDWRAVRAGDAPFGALETAPGLYLQALLAYGYCQLRLGAEAEGREALAKVVEIDPNDRFGAGAILAWADRRAAEEAEDQDLDQEQD